MTTPTGGSEDPPPAHWNWSRDCGPLLPPADGQDILKTAIRLNQEAHQLCGNLTARLDQLERHHTEDITRLSKAFGGLQAHSLPDHLRCTYFKDGFVEEQFGWKYLVTAGINSSHLVEVDTDRDALIIHYIRNAPGAEDLRAQPFWSVNLRTTSAFEHFMGAQVPAPARIIEHHQVAARALAWAQGICLESWAKTKA